MTSKIMTSKRTAVVVGVGAEQGLGAGLASRFAREGYRVYIAGRTVERLIKVAQAISEAEGDVVPVVTDATKEGDVVRLFDFADEAGTLDLVVFNAGNHVRSELRAMPAETFKEAWRVTAFGGFLVGREAARRLVPRGQGTVIFTGATASLRGKPPFTAFASAKAALRSFAQSMAREFGPAGIHVGHVIIDGGIDGERLNTGAPGRKLSAGEDGLLKIDAIADAYWSLHRQQRSAWTHELDLRPFKEPF